MQFQPGERVHVVGIGGFGMSAIARVLLLRGHPVSGSDRAANALTAALARDGATIYAGHDAAHVSGADLVLATSAVPDSHVELAAARAQGIPVYRRGEVMAALMQGHRVIAVAGTHGKTTTTAMIVHLLRECGLDPSYIVGGVMGNTGTNAGVGSTGLFVVEADEYDHMFLGLQPETAVLTSAEWDHPDFFTSPAMLDDAFRRFIALLPEDGCLIACADDPGAARLTDEAEAARGSRGQGRFSVTYSTDPASDAAYRALNLRTGPQVTQMEVAGVGQQRRGTLRLPLAGLHNVRNALAALLVAERLGVPFDVAAAALATFQGTGRRFEVRGESDGVTLIDDYAHHPTAISTTLDAARSRYPGAAVWAVWQPHTYSRTTALIDAYADAFASADHVLVTDIYAAREQPPPDGITGEKAAARIHHPAAQHSGDLDATLKHLLETVRAPAVIIIMSAGDATRLAGDYLAARVTKD